MVGARLTVVALAGLDASGLAALSTLIDDMDAAVEIFDYYLDGGVVSGWFPTLCTKKSSIFAV